MFKKTIHSIAILFLSFQFLSAQSNVQAEKIITSLLADAKTNAIKTNFKLAVTEKNNSPAQTSTGTFTIKGSRFVLEMEEMKVWFDGKTQWAYVQKNNEVSITEPSEKELSETNPMAILSGFKTKSSIRFSAFVKSRQNYCIEMIPKFKNQDITKIEVQVNKTTNNLVSIKLYNKNGNTSMLSLSNFEKEIKASDNSFVFNKTKYNGVVVNDLR
jgi:outer membrane lipoprotein-sorting protein